VTLSEPFILRQAQDEREIEGERTAPMTESGTTRSVVGEEMLEARQRGKRPLRGSPLSFL